MEFLSLLDNFSTIVKVGWIGFVVWLALQVAWFRHAFRPVEVTPKPRTRSSGRSSKSAVRRRSTFRATGSPEFLAGLGMVDGPVSQAYETQVK